MTKETVHRNWGWWEVLEENTSPANPWKPREMRSKLKVLVVNPGGALSLQYHKHRAEYWFIASGIGKIERGRSNLIEFLYAGMMVHIQPEELHRLINCGDNELVVYEIQYGDKCEEEDIVRI